jgi:glycosyltransferase involved in cell wall biosynthesis
MLSNAMFHKDEQMKILLVTHSYGLNGAALMLRDAARYWVQEMQWEIDALISDAEFLKHGEALKNLGINPRQTISLKVNDYDVAVVNTLIDVEMVTKLCPFMPIVLWVHEGQSIIFNSNMSISALTRAFSNCKSIIFQTLWQSESIYKSFLQHLPSSRIHIIPSGVDIDGVPFKENHALEQTIKLITVGTVYPRKRQMDLVQAVDKLAIRYKIECYIVGDTSEARDWQSRVQSDTVNPNSVIKWLGPINDRKQINKLLNEADIACFPSGDESHPLALLEAGLCSLPLVLSKLAPYEYIGWENSQNCLLHETGNIEELEMKIESLILDQTLRSYLGRNARDLVIKKYNKTKFYKSITELISKSTFKS